MRLRTAILLLSLLLLGLLVFWRIKAASALDSFPAPPALELTGPDFSGEKLAIEGQVLGPDGAPLAEAWVSVVGRKKVLSAYCGAEGRFRVEGLPEGDFEVTAAARGFRPESVTVQAGGGAATIHLEPLGRFGAGPEPPPAPEANAIFNARIVRAAGAPSGFAAALIPTDPSAAPDVFRAAVDSEGFFQFDGLAPGAYRLLVLAAARAHDLEFCFREVDIEIGPGKKPPGTIEVSTMEVGGVALAPPLPDVFPAPDPLPQEGAVVRLRLLRRGGRAAEAGWVDTGADGRFRFASLPEGSYEVTVLASGFERLVQTVEAAPDSSLDLRLFLTRKSR